MFACVTVHKLKTASYTTDLSECEFWMRFFPPPHLWIFDLPELYLLCFYDTQRWLQLEWYKALSCKWETLLPTVVCSDNFRDFDIPLAKHCKNHSTVSTQRHFINHSKSEWKSLHPFFFFFFKGSLQQGPAVTNGIGGGGRIPEGYKSRAAAG